MPRSAEQLEAARQRSRERILDAALDLFARLGYEGATVRLIAREAGVAQGLLYNYFPSKEAVLRALFERSMLGVRESWQAGGDAACPCEALELLIRRSFELVRRDRRFWRLAHAVRAQPAVVASLGADLQAWTAAVQANLQGRLEAAGAADPEVEARVLYALIDGAALHYTLDPDRYPLDAVVSRIVTLYARPRTGQGGRV